MDRRGGDRTREKSPARALVSPPDLHVARGLRRTTWLLLVVRVTPAVAPPGLGVVVLISARVATAHEAFQVGGLVVLPVVVLLPGQISGVLFFGPAPALGPGAVLWLLALASCGWDFATFRRTSLICRV